MQDSIAELYLPLVIVINRSGVFFSSFRKADLRNGSLSSVGCRRIRNGSRETADGFHNEKGCAEAIAAWRAGRRRWQKTDGV